MASLVSSAAASLYPASVTALPATLLATHAVERIVSDEVEIDKND